MPEENIPFNGYRTPLLSEAERANRRTYNKLLELNRTILTITENHRRVSHELHDLREEIMLLIRSTLNHESQIQIRILGNNYGGTAPTFRRPSPHRSNIASSPESDEQPPTLPRRVIVQMRPPSPDRSSR